MSDPGQRRGHPLVVLTMVLTAWIGLRVAVWRESAYAAFERGAVNRLSPYPRAAASDAAQDPDAAAPYGYVRPGALTPWPLGARPAAAAAAAGGPVMAPPRFAGEVRPAAFGAAAGTAQQAPSGAEPGGAGWFDFLLPGTASKPQLAEPATPAPRRGNWLLSLFRRKDPGSTAHFAGSGAGPGGNEAPAGPTAAQPTRPPSRWSGDAWLLVRREGDGTAAVGAGPTPATYGANQSGAVLRYAFSRDDPRRLAAYTRVTSALNGAVDSEVALGLQGRPIASVPVVALGEVRLSRQADGLHVRPSVIAVTQLPPFPLTLGAQGDVYLQGGYVAGPYATAFVDGQVHVDRHLAKLGKGELRIGGGSWGGAQRGASRLDVGPEASWRFALTRKASARLSLDWRIRVAGNAEPPSGPALTLAAGF